MCVHTMKDGHVFKREQKVFCDFCPYMRQEYNLFEPQYPSDVFCPNCFS